MELTLRDYLGAIKRRKWIVAFALLLGVGSAVAINHFTQPIYRATAQIEFRRAANRSLLTGQVLDASSFQAENVALYTAAELITNRELMGRVVSGLNERGGVFDDVPEIATDRGRTDWLLDRVSVDPVRDTRLVNVRAEHWDPRVAEAICDLVASEFVQEQNHQTESGSENLTSYFKEQVEDVRNRIADGEQGLLRAGGSADPVTLRSRLDQLNPAIASLRRDLAESDAQLARAREVYKGRHPKLTALEAENQKVQQSLQESEEEVASINRSLRRQSVLQGELENNRELYATLIARVQELEINGQTQAPLVNLVEAATADPSPIRPHKILNLLVCSGAGLLLGLGLAFLAEHMRRTIRTPEDVASQLELPVLGLIPKVSRP